MLPYVLNAKAAGATATTDTQNYFYTVGELRQVIASGEKKDGRDVTQLALRVLGQVRPGSIAREPAQLITRFEITDPKDPEQTLSVVYRKAGVPDTFKDNAEAVVEGRYTQDGVFEAEVLFAKCPSKYKARDPEGQGHPDGIPRDV